MPKTRSLPSNPNLEKLKKQAKTLLRAFRNKEPAALEMVTRLHPQPNSFGGLRDAQLVVSRQYGFDGWADLSEAVELARLETGDGRERAEKFLGWVSHHEPGRRAAAAQLLDRHPEIATFDVYTAAACAEVEALGKFLNEDLGLATRKGGPCDWSPVLYLCNCRLPEPPERDHLACLRLLLDAGADPNDHFIGYEKYVQTALTGVVGEGEQGIERNPPLRQARAMVELLLAAGAKPNDSQALYNTHFRPDTEWLELLIEHGLQQGQRVNWDPNGPTTVDFLLCQAAKQGFERRVQLLLAAGANPDAPDMYNQRPAYVNALRHGHKKIADLLLKAGAKSTPQPADELRIALLAHDEARVDELLAAEPGLIEDREAMCELATESNIAAIELLLKHRVDVNAPNRNGRLAIQEAAIRNNRELVLLLLDHGSRLDWRDPHYGGSPVGWAMAGGNIELRDELLDRTNDVFDLTRYGRLEQLKFLLEESPEAASQRTARGHTPLHQVCGGTPHAAEIIDLLLSKGADLNAKNNDGQTPLTVQEEPDDDAIIELLKARGAGMD